jgi:hypothetical protein
MKHLRTSTVLAALAIFALIGGTATATSLINGKQIKPGTITSKQIRNKTITTAKLSPQTVRSLKGRTGATGATGPAGIVSPLSASTGTVNLPNDVFTEVFSLDLPAGTWVLTGRVSVISQAASNSNRISCSIALDEVSDFDLADTVGQSPLQQNDEINLSLLAVATVTDKATVLCNSDSGVSQVVQGRVIAVPVAQ